MRFDDMIDTVLAQPLNGGSMRATVYRQLIDLIAQGRAEHDEGLARRAYEAIDQIRDEVPVEARARLANALTGLPVPKRLVAHIGRERVRDIVNFLSAARLSEQDWLDILPGLPPQSRSLLRSRRDLPPAVLSALEAFGPSDLALAPPDEPEFPWVEDYGETPAPPPPPPIYAGGQPQAEGPKHAAAAHAAPEGRRRVDHLFAAAPSSAETSRGYQERDPALVAGETQIRELLSRIEQFRSRIVHRQTEPEDDIPINEAETGLAQEPSPAREAPPSAPDFAASEAVSAKPATGSDDARAPLSAATDGPMSDTASATGGFRWETDAAGTIIWVEGVAREAVIGRSVALSEPEAIEGVDIRSATAFARRAPFHDGRLRLPGSGAASGLWVISGVPFFDPRGGRFGGFRGTARRFEEPAAPVSAQPEPQVMASVKQAPPSPDAVRQMAHELRTPLNAIAGFAEMIDRQMLGPAAQTYRDKAQEILGDAHRLLAAIDDIDATARGAAGAAGGPPLVDAGGLVERVIGRYQGLSRERGIELIGSIALGLPGIETSEEVLERVVSRLFAAVIGAARAGDRLTYGVGLGEGDAVRIFLSRPSSLAGRNSETLYDPASAGFAAGLEAPALGLGFGLRLVRQLVSALGGKFEIEDALFMLMLPCHRIERPMAGSAA